MSTSTSTGRKVYDKMTLLDFQSSRIESIAAYDNGQKLLVGTTDGNMSAVHCRTSNISGPDTVPTFYKCLSTETVRKPFKDKKPIQSLRIVQGWKVFLCIVDGQVTAYDLQSYQQLAQLGDSKGCSLFGVHEGSSLLFVGAKRKLTIYQWQGIGFASLKELVTAETPRLIYCTSNFIVIGYKKHYEAMNLSTFTSVKICDVDREHRMMAIEIPQFPKRSSSIIVSNSLQGIMFDITGNLLTAVNNLPTGGAGTNNAPVKEGGIPNGSLGGVNNAINNTNPSVAVVPYDSRLEWASAPIQSVCILPYLITLQGSQVEIHNVLTLSVVQTIKLTTTAGSLTGSIVPIMLTSSNNLAGVGGIVSSSVDGQTYAQLKTSLRTNSIASSGASDYSQSYAKHTFYVAQADGIVVYPMVPLPTQIASLVDSGKYEDALALCSLCSSEASSDSQVLNYVSVPDIHKKYALNIYQRGDFEGAINHFLLAETKFKEVLALFPEMFPKNFTKFEVYLKDTSGLAGSGRGAGSGPNARAASALVSYCEKIRPNIRNLAEQVEDMRKLSGRAISGSNSSGKAAHTSASSSLLLTIDPDEVIRDATILDTIYVSALIHCNPPRRNAIVNVLSKKNYCHLDSCSLLIASQGNAFTEALLWLFRSHGDHKRVLSALSESNCCGDNAWTQKQYYNWVSEYLTLLWHHDHLSAEKEVDNFSINDDEAITHGLLVHQVLPVLKTVFEYDAKTGLNILIRSSHEHDKAPVSLGAVTFSSKGIALKEVLEFLKSIENPGTTGNVHCAVNLPVATGEYLQVAYLSWVVGSSVAPPDTHDLYIKLLLDVISKSGDEDLVRVYRNALQSFLQASTEYDPEVTQNLMPTEFVHEHALILSSLGEYEKVLEIYIFQLHDFKQCEEYCNRIYCKSCHINAIESSIGVTTVQGSMFYISPSNVDGIASGSGSKSELHEKGANVYYFFIKVLFDYLLHLESLKHQDALNAHANEINLGADADSDDEFPNHIQASTHNNDLTLSHILEYAEKYYDRLDSRLFLALVPSSTSVKMLSKYLKLVYEFENSKKRNLQIIHQLLRVREVNLRTAELTNA